MILHTHGLPMKQALLAFSYRACVYCSFCLGGDGTESHSGRLCSDSTSLNVRISKMKHFSFSFFFAGIITPHKDPAPPPARVSVENSTETRPLTFDATRKQ